MAGSRRGRAFPVDEQCSAVSAGVQSRIKSLAGDVDIASAECL